MFSLILQSTIYILVICAIKLFFDYIEDRFNYSSFNTEKLENLLKSGMDDSDHILYSRLNKNVKLPGLYEIRFYKQNDIPTFVVITQIECVKFNNDDPEYGRSLEAMSTDDEKSILKETDILQNYVPIFGVTFSNDGENHIELAPDNGLKGLV